MSPARQTTARLLAGAPIAAEIKARVKTDVASFRRRHGFAPTLAVVLVGRDAPSAVYLEQILRTCRSVGISGRRVEIPARGSAARLRNTLVALNEDPLVSGVIVQMPLPRRIPLSVVVGRSNVVGKPAALLLLRENATVTVCHSQTRDLAAQTRTADIVVVAVGRPGLITGEMLKRGAVVVDVGINVVGGRIVGDVDVESVGHVASALTPVPGGVGPVTNALLMTHVLRAAERQARAERPRTSGRGRGSAAGARPGAGRASSPVAPAARLAAASR